jgi:hypothetical protein
MLKGLGAGVSPKDQWSNSLVGSLSAHPAILNYASIMAELVLRQTTILSKELISLLRLSRLWRRGKR